MKKTLLAFGLISLLALAGCASTPAETSPAPSLEPSSTASPTPGETSGSEITPEAMVSILNLQPPFTDTPPELDTWYYWSEGDTEVSESGRYGMLIAEATGNFIQCYQDTNYTGSLGLISSTTTPEIFVNTYPDSECADKPLTSLSVTIPEGSTLAEATVTSLTGSEDEPFVAALKGFLATAETGVVTK